MTINDLRQQHDRRDAVINGKTAQPISLGGIHRCPQLPKVAPPCVRHGDDIAPAVRRIRGAHDLVLCRQIIDERVHIAAIDSTAPSEFGLTDSPAGQLAWIAENVLTWAGSDTPVATEWLRATATLSWLTRTAASSDRLYLESAGRRGPISTEVMPVGVAVFPQDLVQPVRALAEPNYRITQWTEMPRGGYFAALETPDLLVPDLRDCFRPLRDAPWPSPRSTSVEAGTESPPLRLGHG